MKNALLTLILMAATYCMSAQNYLHETAVWKKFDVCIAGGYYASETNIREEIR